MKKLLSVVLVMLLAVGMTGCGSSSNGKTELLIGVSPDYPPYESYNNKKEMVGFDIDMTKELVKIMNKNGGNYSYKFKALSFDAISSSLTSILSKMYSNISITFTKPLFRYLYSCNISSAE